MLLACSLFFSLWPEGKFNKMKSVILLILAGRYLYKQVHSSSLCFCLRYSCMLVCGCDLSFNVLCMKKLSESVKKSSGKSFLKTIV